jgi:hypothetical protein
MHRIRHIRLRPEPTRQANRVLTQVLPTIWVVVTIVVVVQAAFCIKPLACKAQLAAVVGQLEV